MRGRSLTALALSSLVAAVCVAVPALAGSSARKGPAAGLTGANLSTSDEAARQSASKPVSRERCESTGSGKHRVVLCAITGATGPPGRSGPRGFVGTRGGRGPKGTTGGTGATGPTGAAGSARAYGVVNPKNMNDLPELVSALTHDLLTVTRRPVGQGVGVYCIAPAAGINPATEPAIASGESSYGTQAPEAAPIAVVNAQPTAGTDPCASNEYKVETFSASPTGTARSDEVAFSIAVP